MEEWIITYTCDFDLFLVTLANFLASLLGDLLANVFEYRSARFAVSQIRSAS